MVGNRHQDVREVKWSEADRQRLINGTEPVGDCLIWIGAKDPERGYGRITIDRTSVATHQISYIMHKGSIPKGVLVTHTCDNPACVNPEHLVLGTPVSNMQDKVNRGRSFHPTGVLNRSAKLTEDDVFSIYNLQDKGTSAYTIHKQYYPQVSYTIIRKVCRGLTWQHLYQQHYK